jgi:hypothetical protein
MSVCFPVSAELFHAIDQLKPSMAMNTTLQQVTFV